MANEVRPMMVGDRMTRQQAVARGKGDIQNYMDAGISSLEMLPMYMTGTEDAVNDALRISRSTANEQNYTDDDRTEDTLRHILLGGLVEVGKDESIFGAKNFMGTGIGSKIASKLIDARETDSPESKIDLINNEFGRQLRKAFPDRKEFIQEAVKVAQQMYAGKDVAPINDVAPALSYGATTPPEQAEGGIMMAQQGQAVLPVTEATSAPQGGGPKAANPAAKPTLAPPPTKAPRPGSQDPRDKAMQEVAQELQADKAPQPAPPAPQPVQQPMQPVGGLAAPQQPPAVPMMAKGGTTDEKPEGLAVMIGLGAPTPSYEDAAEGNPPPGATKEEVADDQLVLLSEGELVVPANVVRYHGLGTYEGMRREALMGLQDMEQNGQIEYVSGGKEKADKIDDNGGIVKAQAGTYLAPPMGQGIANNPQFGINYAAPATYRPTTLVTPVAASSQFVKTPGQQTPPQVPSVLGMTGGVRALNTTNPLLLPYTPVIPSSVTGVYAPNVGQYQTSIDSGAQPETPEVPTVPTPTTPTPPPQDEGGGDRDLSPEEIAAQAEREGRIQDRKDAAAQLGYTKHVGLIEGLASSLGYGTPEIGTVMADGTIADGRGNTFDPITGKQVGFKGGIIGNIAGNLGLMDRETPADIAANIPEASYAGLRSLPGEQSIANVLAEVGTPAQTIADLGVVAPNPGMMSPTVDELSTSPMDSAVASPSVQGLAAPTVDAGLPDELTGSPMGAANVMGTAQDAQFAGQTSSRGPTSSMSPGRSQAQFGTPAYAGIPTATVDSIAAAAAKASAPLSPEEVASMQAQIQQETTIRNDLISKGVPPSLASLQAKAQTAQSTQTGQQMSGLGLDTTPSGAFSPDNVSGASKSAGSLSNQGVGAVEPGAAARAEEARSARESAAAAGYEKAGYSKEVAGNKAKADEMAKAQSGNANATAVTDSKGNAVTSTNPDGTKSVVTSGAYDNKGHTSTGSYGTYGELSGSPHDNTGGGSEGCFAKGTLIMMDDGTQKPVEDVDIGDEVKLGGFVFATGKFLINNLYNYKGIEVSGSHMVLEDDKWLRVEDSELATLVSEDDTIVYVFGSENRRIVIDDVVFTDYFEVNEQEKLKQVGDSYFTNWKESAKITSKSNVEVRNTNDADAPTLAA